MNSTIAGADGADGGPLRPHLTELQRGRIEFCARKAEACLRGARHADEDADLTKDRRYRTIASESRQDAQEYTTQAFGMAEAR